MRRLIILTIFFGLLIAGFVFAESQKLPPPLSQGQPRKLQAQPSNNSDVNPATTKKITQTLPTPIIDKGESTPENSSSNTSGNGNTPFNPCNDDPMIRYTFWLMIFTGVLAISTIGLWFVTFLAGKDTKKAADAAQKSADAALQAATANIFMGRAYVKITSCSPGIIFIMHPIPPPHLACKLEIKNYGETPACITDIMIQATILEVGQLLPDIPNFDGAKRYKFSNAFLVRSESIFYHFFDETILTEALIVDIKEGNKILCLYGFVDYIDAFGNRHRGGFGQNYYQVYDRRENYASDEAFTARNNLTFLMQAGYNYDRQRKDGEGRE